MGTCEREKPCFQMVPIWNQVPIQLPFWGGVSPLQPMRSIVFSSGFAAGSVVTPINANCALKPACNLREAILNCRHWADIHRRCISMCGVMVLGNPSSRYHHAVSSRIQIPKLLRPAIRESFRNEAKKSAVRRCPDSRTCKSCCCFRISAIIRGSSASFSSSLSSG